MNEHTTLYVFRHGQSEQNLTNLVFGHNQTPLTKFGEEQANLIRLKLRHINFDIAVSSDLRRAVQTAQIILDERPIPIETTAQLRERHYGIAEGETEEFLVTEIEKRADLIRELNEKSRLRFPPVKGMETDEDVINRVMLSLHEKAHQNPGKTILVASHGNLMRTLLVNLRYGNYRELPAGSVKNTAYMRLKYHSRRGFWLEAVVGVTKQKPMAEEDKLGDFIRYHAHIV